MIGSIFCHKESTLVKKKKRRRYHTLASYAARADLIDQIALSPSPSLHVMDGGGSWNMYIFRCAYICTISFPHICIHMYVCGVRSIYKYIHVHTIIIINLKISKPAEKIVICMYIYIYIFFFNTDIFC